MFWLSPQRSTSPNTMSRVPIIATISANMWFLPTMSVPARWANPGALILHLYWEENYMKTNIIIIVWGIYTLVDWEKPPQSTWYRLTAQYKWISLLWDCVHESHHRTVEYNTCKAWRNHQTQDRLQTLPWGPPLQCMWLPVAPGNLVWTPWSGGSAPPLMTATPRVTINTLHNNSLVSGKQRSNSVWHP